VRFWPQMLRLAILAGLCMYTAANIGRLLRVNVVRLQFGWLSLILGSLLFQSQVDRPQALYVAYYVFWIVVFWAVLCMVDRGYLTTKQVALVGTLMNLIMSARLLVFIASGVWIGRAQASVGPKDRITDQGYVLLWFTLMQLLEPVGFIGKAVAVTSMVAVVLTLERGSLISLLVGLLIYSAIQAYLVPRQRKRIAILSSSSLIAISFAIWMSADRIAVRWLDLSNSKTAGSGRLSFWSSITTAWMNSDLVTKIFGFGPLSVQNEVGTFVVFAHNDFLEQLHCFGILGVLFYVAICVAMLIEGFRLVKSRSNMASVFCAAAAVFISTGLYLSEVCSTDMVWFAIVAGTALASARFRERKVVRSMPRFRIPFSTVARPAQRLAG